ncbi:cytidine/deoxycytidylate deaminase family protein [bacterium]|nr:cytidine/deoxycytidylate deaminase family protein [candidate division CSSED10-310 bacterium]
MEIVYLIARRSTCLRRKVGAVIVKENQILATGYNGVPSGIRHCSQQGGCLREQLAVPSGQRHELCRGLHAEQNAIIQAAVHGSSIKGGTLYCTTMPCIVCIKMLINAGIKKVVFSEGYQDELAKEMMDQADIIIRQFSVKE